MAGRQGKRFTTEEVVRVQYLLATTELTPREIAYRMGASASSILSINRRSQIRRYNGRRSQWEMGLESGQQVATLRL